jgi:hypothetical protein
MIKHDPNTNTRKNISAQPRLHQQAAEIQAYGTVAFHPRSNLLGRVPQAKGSSSPRLYCCLP